MWILTGLGNALQALTKLRPETERERERIRYYESKQYNRWFGEICTELSIRRKEAKLQWLQDPSQMNGDGLKSVNAKLAETKKPSISFGTGSAIRSKANFGPSGHCHPRSSPLPRVFTVHSASTIFKCILEYVLLGCSAPPAILPR
jgi:hypothetical protein